MRGEQLPAPVGGLTDTERERIETVSRLAHEVGVQQGRADLAAEVSALPRAWELHQCGVLGPGLRAAAASLRAVLAADSTPTEPTRCVTPDGDCLMRVRAVEDPDFVLPWNEEPADSTPREDQQP